MSIVKKLQLLTLLIVSAAVAAIVAMTWSFSEDALHRLEGKRISESVEREARILQGSINMIKSDLAMLADGGAKSVVEEGAASTLDGLQMLADQLDVLMRERSAYRQVKVVTAGPGAPRVLVSTRMDGAVRTMIDPPVNGWSFQELLSERQGIRGLGARTNSLKGDEASERVFFFSLPIRDQDRNEVGAIAVMADADRMFATLGRSRDDISFWVADGSGRYLYQSRSEFPIGGGREQSNAIRDFDLTGSWERLASGASPSMVVELPSRSMIVAVSNVRISPSESSVAPSTVIVGGISSSAGLEAQSKDIRSQLVVRILVVCLLMMLAMFLISSRFLRPVRELAATADRIAAGDRSVTFPRGRSDEIEVLSAAMERMAEGLRKEGSVAEKSAIGQMATMIAHDLRNALSSVKMNLQILETHHRDAGGREIDHCDIALDQVRYMETILNDMLTYARPESVRFDWVDLDEVLRTATISLLPETTAKSVDLVMTGEQKLPTIMADRTKLVQVIQNILANAIFAVSEWGRVTITTRCLMHESQPAVEIRIEDNGPGISPQVADKVFEPFFTTSTKGTGLGLAIVKRIVDQHHGTVCLDTEKTDGAAVVVLLPLTQPEPANSADASAEPPAP